MLTIYATQFLSYIFKLLDLSYHQVLRGSLLLPCTVTSIRIVYYSQLLSMVASYVETRSTNCYVPEPSSSDNL